MSIKVIHIINVGRFKRGTIAGFRKGPIFIRTGEEEGGEKHRATDAIWSLKMFDLKKSVVSPDQPVLYYLSNGAPKCGFVPE